MDNTTKKVFQFLAKIIRWQFMVNGWYMDSKSRKMLDDICKSDFSDFEEDNS